MIEDLWKESSLAAALEELAEERGEARGEARGMRQMAQVALVGRFGPLGEDVRGAVQAADEGTLKLVVTHLYTDTIEQMRARLGLS